MDNVLEILNSCFAIFVFVAAISLLLLMYKLNGDMYRTVLGREIDSSIVSEYMGD